MTKFLRVIDCRSLVGSQNILRETVESLIGLDRLTNLLEVVIHTGALRNSVPISVLMVARPGAAKSKQLLAFDSTSIHLTNDMTTAGLFDCMSRDRDNKIRHIVLPDMNAVLSHKGTTSELFFGNLLALMSEGITRIDDGRYQKEIPHLPVGMITAATPGMYESNIKKWEKTGLKRRFLPLFYDYTSATRMKINEGIRNGSVTLHQVIRKKIVLPKVPALVNIGDAEGLRLESMAQMLAGHLSWFPARERDTNKKIMCKPSPGEMALEFTPHLILRSLCCAHALRARRGKVNNDDLNFVMGVIDFCRYGSPVLL